MYTDKTAGRGKRLRAVLDALLILLVFWAADRLAFPGVLRAFPAGLAVLMALLCVLDSYHSLYCYRFHRRQPLAPAVGLALAGGVFVLLLRLGAGWPADRAVQALVVLAACCPVLLAGWGLLLLFVARRFPDCPPEQAYLLLTGDELLDLNGAAPDAAGLRRRPVDQALKAAFDRTAALAGLILCAPLFLVIAAAIKLDSAGPVFYRQERYTIHKKRFDILKFRTMVLDAEKDGVQLATEGDVRVTRVGRVLRRFRLDELPQLVDILRGEMSFVGPRPERPFYADEFCRRVPNYDRRYLVKAGLTGIAQVYGSYSTQARDKAAFDCLYIRRFSLWLDFRLMLQTVMVVFIQEASAGVKEESLAGRDAAL